MDTNGTLEGPLRDEALRLLNLIIHEGQALGTVTVINNNCHISCSIFIERGHTTNNLAAPANIYLFSVGCLKCLQCHNSFQLQGVVIQGLHFFSLTVEVYQVRPYVSVRAKAAPSYQLLQCPECWSN